MVAKYKLVIFFALFFLKATSVSAEFAVEDYHQFKGNAPQFDDYLTGLGRGVFWSNTVLEVEGRDKIFCMPSGLSLDQGIILSVIDQEVRSPANRDSWGNDAPIELIAVHAFKNKFPCS
ncbi:hypothetical protein [Halomonas sp. THAF12]|uniref:hypothetical protein n=1 Tax=Halomonas sp. THAF12 TaxID=2587849 RepID=UPI0012687935|nr:hypothetical protein [Halomonas sp. THAF12]